MEPQKFKCYRGWGWSGAAYLIHATKILMSFWTDLACRGYLFQHTAGGIMSIKVNY